MRILIIADEIWNNKIHGNNVLTNWFQGFPAEFAMITCSPGTPYNNICQNYYQITDKQMLNSIFDRKSEAGVCLKGDFSAIPDTSDYNSTDVANLEILRKYFGNILRLMKTVVWNCGNINEEGLKKFVQEFDPEIIFSARYAHSKILRIENYAKQYADCPLVAFTGDNEYSFRRFSLSPVFWMNLLYQRWCLRRQMPKYAMYYSLSEQQIHEFGKHFSVQMKILRKCSPCELVEYKAKPVKIPIQIVYAGKIYEGREDTLRKLCESIRRINRNEKYFELHIYTGTKLSRRLLDRLQDNTNTYVHVPVSSNELRDIYRRSDIALSVESFRLSYRLGTRLSFSTKLIDCLGSSCAVMMIGWEQNAGFVYLKNNHAAICIKDIKEIDVSLNAILHSPDILLTYQKNAYDCMIRYHQRKEVQRNLYEDFSKIIQAYKESLSEAF